MLALRIQQALAGALQMKQQLTNGSAMDGAEISIVRIEAESMQASGKCLRLSLLAKTS